MNGKKGRTLGRVRMYRTRRSIKRNIVVMSTAAKTFGYLVPYQLRSVIDDRDMLAHPVGTAATAILVNLLFEVARLRSEVRSIYYPAWHRGKMHVQPRMTLSCIGVITQSDSCGLMALRYCADWLPASGLVDWIRHSLRVCYMRVYRVSPLLAPSILVSWR